MHTASLVAEANVTDKEAVEVPLKKDGPCPSWLVNMKYLSPLIGAYDEKMKEKDHALAHCRLNII